jgi:hypothetical protein
MVEVVEFFDIVALCHLSHENAECVSDLVVEIFEREGKVSDMGWLSETTLARGVLECFSETDAHWARHLANMPLAAMLLTSLAPDEFLGWWYERWDVFMQEGTRKLFRIVAAVIGICPGLPEIRANFFMSRFIPVGFRLCIRSRQKHDMFADALPSVIDFVTREELINAIPRDWKRYSPIQVWRLLSICAMIPDSDPVWRSAAGRAFVILEAVINTNDRKTSKECAGYSFSVFAALIRSGVHDPAEIVGEMALLRVVGWGLDDERSFELQLQSLSLLLMIGQTIRPEFFDSVEDLFFDRCAPMMSSDREFWLFLKIVIEAADLREQNLRFMRAIIRCFVSRNWETLLSVYELEIMRELVVWCGDFPEVLT